ncbi:UNVERIFIED_CONTAM: hypothetical protein RMT77_003598 [Armadillidium vulgare]
MLVSTSGFALIISLFINSVDCALEGRDNLTNEVSSFYLDIEMIQKTLSDDNPSSENLLKIVKDLSSTLILMISQLENSKSFETALSIKMQNLQNEMEELRKDMNETECSLSIRIIEMENSIFKLKEKSESGKESQAISSTESKKNSIFKLKEKSESGNESQTISSTESRGRKTISNRNSVLTPSLPYRQARMYCHSIGGTPFVPKTKDEFFYLVEEVTKDQDFGWLPLTDILNEGVGEWDDGTSYAEGPIHLKFADTNELHGNTYDKDCVDVNKGATGDWYECSSLRKMLCITYRQA